MIAEPTVNPRRYGKLLAKTLPAVIETEEENERMLAELEPLFDKGEKRTPEEDRLYKLMLHFEDKHYDFHATTPLNILKHFMEVRDVKPKDLWEVFGTRSVTSEVL